MLSNHDQIVESGIAALRITQVHTSYRQRGGEDAAVEAEAELLRSGGHQVIAHRASNPDDLAGSIVALGLAVWNPAAAGRLRKALLAHESEVVHVHNTWFAMSPAVIAEAHKHAPVVMTVHNYRLVCSNALLFRAGHPCRLCLEGSSWNGALHNCYRDPISSVIAAASVGAHRRTTWSRGVDLFTVLSDFHAGILAEADVPAEKIQRKDNFVTDPGLRSSAAHHSEEVFFVGRLTEEKGVRELTDQADEIRKAGLRLRIIGAGPLAAEVRVKMGDSYLGSMPPAQVRARMMSGRALLFPSLCYEGQPLTVLEAFAAALPVFGSERGAAGELLGEQGGVHTFDPQSSHDWASAISAIADDATIHAGSARARRLFETRFSPLVALPALEETYRRAISLRRS